MGPLSSGGDERRRRTSIVHLRRCYTTGPTEPRTFTSPSPASRYFRVASLTSDAERSTGPSRHADSLPLTPERPREPIDARGSSRETRKRRGAEGWIGLFATATRRAVADAAAFEGRVQLLELAWRERLGRVRADSAVVLLLRRLPGAPILTVRSAAELIGRSTQATNEAITRLTAANVLVQTTVGRRNRAFEAPEVISAFTDLERQLASPTGDTRTDPPARRVPRRG